MPHRASLLPRLSTKR